MSIQNMYLTDQDCAKVIYRYTQKNVQLLQFETTPLGDSPMGFLGEHNKLTITYQTCDGAVKHTSFFLKTLPNGNAEHMSYINGTGVFQKEVLLYKHLLEGNNLVVLEDLSLNNYRVPTNDLKLKEWMALVKTMACFHASSIIYEERRSIPGKPYRINTHYPSLTKEDTFVTDPNHPRYHSTKGATQAVADSFKLFDNYNSTISEKFIKFVNETIGNLVAPSDTYRNVLNHADLWRNNVMFKTDHRGEIACVLIDFQLARYAPPVLDLLTALHINARTEFLDANFDGIIEEYYRQLAGCLKEHELNWVVTYEVFMESVECYKLVGLVEAALFATIIFIGPKLAQGFVENEELFREFAYENRSKHVVEEFKSNERFRERYSDVIRRLLKELEK